MPALSPSSNKKRACVPALYRLIVIQMVLSLFACVHKAYRIIIPKAEIERNLAETFPMTETIGGGASITLSDPVLFMDERSNRIRIRLNVSVTPANLAFLELTRGSMAINTGLSFDSQSAQFLLDKASVDSFDLELRVNPDIKRELLRVARIMVEERIEGTPVHRLDPHSITTPIAKLLIRRVKIENTSVVVVLGFK